MTDFPAFIALESLDGANGFRLDGIDPGDFSGRSVASAGDFNGDGYDDIIIGATSGDPDGASNAGESYLVFGKRGGFSASFDFSALDGANGFRLDGIDEFDQSGRSVASAGDLNGDGFDDIIIGAPKADRDPDFTTGESFVVFGKAAGFAASLDLASLDGANGFRLDGTDDYGYAGQAVASAGDVNGDGFDDLLIGAPKANTNGAFNAGESYVVFGKAGGFAASLNLVELDGADGFRLEGIDVLDESGSSLASAGDFNGDGFDDLIIGAPGGNFFDTSAGESYVVFGKPDGFARRLDLADLDGANGFRLVGIADSDRSGNSVASAGDFNGDGFDDVIIGVRRADPNGVNYAGESYVVFGKAGGFSASFELADLDGANGFRVNGIDPYDLSGSTVASAGDVNGDGFDDLIIGADNDAPNGELVAGSSYVVFGKQGGFAASLDLADLDGANGFRIDGIDSLDESGYSVASAGDVDGDGFDDLIIGAPFADPNGDDAAGESYVVFGLAPTEPVKRIGSAADQAISGGAFDDTLSGRGGDDTLVGAAGDDALRGGGGADQLIGGAGADRLEASLGGDVLTGGRGSDVFALDDEVAGSDRVTVAGFKSGVDRIEIDADDFGGGLIAGSLDPNAFVANTTGLAEDAEDRFIYDIDSGKLFFDADGTGAEGRDLIAVLSGAPGLGEGDFELVGGGDRAEASAARAFAAPDAPLAGLLGVLMSGGTPADLRAPDMQVV